MTARRAPSTPPLIPGHTYARLLGMGGFADVFLYEQQRPRRWVAVKVLLAASLSDAVRERFRTEADLMARLSHHPSIVTVHHADVAADGRPYLVMEHCSQPNLGERYRGEPLGVAEVLRIGVRLASAVETAHRAGVLHRDIKPANVLVTDFGWPALTDFGIAATTGSRDGAAVGMSIPWAPPELLAEEPTGDERSDVYSLAATLYSLLAGRTPFEVPGGGNTAADLVARIERSPWWPTGRADVPAGLHAVLARAMHRDPARRHASARELARDLQGVETGMLLPVTPVDLADDAAAAEVPTPTGGEADQATRVRPVPSISADAPGDPAHADAAGDDARRDAAAGDAPGEAPVAVGVPAAWADQARAVPAPAPDPTAPRRRAVARTVAGAAAGLALLAAVTTGAVLSFADAPSAAPTADAAPTGGALPPAPPAVRAVPAPTDVTGVRTADGVEFTWSNPDPQDGDRYLWGLARPGRPTALEVAVEPHVTVTPSGPEERVCVEVAVVRPDGRYSTEPAVGCVE